MPLIEWKVPPANQPRASGTVSISIACWWSACIRSSRATPSAPIPWHRAGNGVVIDDGLVLTIGYLTPG